MRGSHCDEDEGARPQRRFFLPLLLLALLVLNFGVSTFDYHRHLLPPPERAVRLCNTTALRAQHSLVEGAIGFRDAIGGGVPVKLYATTLVRDVVCRATDGETEHLVYRDLYLNISAIDVDAELAALSARYAPGALYKAWRYDELLPEVDRHGLTDTPLDPYRDYARAQMLAKVELLLAAVFLTGLVLLGVHLWHHLRLTMARMNK